MTIDFPKIHGNQLACEIFLEKEAIVFQKKIVIDKDNHCFSFPVASPKNGLLKRQNCIGCAWSLQKRKFVRKLASEKLLFWKIKFVLMANQFSLKESIIMSFMRRRGELCQKVF
ncbi:hypothetical protein I8F96_05960 [Enterococcus casseliflavus]|nr:hypothetical protein [Enterococcus casseliflavus]